MTFTLDCKAVLACFALGGAAFGCNTAGSDWMAQPLEGELVNPPLPEAEDEARRQPGAVPRRTRTQVIAAARPSQPVVH